VDRRRTRADERAAANEVLRRRRAEDRARVRTVQAVAVCFAGSLAAFLGHPGLLFILIAGCGLAAVAILPGDAWPEALGRPPAPLDLAWATAGAAASLAIGFGWALVLTAGGGLQDLAWNRPSAALVLTIAIVPAFVEEFLCRGALWAACRRLTTERATIVVTAALFGLIHAMDWGVLGVPSRVGAGLVFGFLRAKTGGLTAPIAAHLLNNFVAAGFVADP
jgi:membrane protease YdiL (CAAX protease family)